MFKRVFVEEWAHIIPFISFFIFFTVFIFITIRAMRLGKNERSRLAQMPLEDSSDNSQS
jgi:cbb3-type cytochrome oxidase subunit 3